MFRLRAAAPREEDGTSWRTSFAAADGKCDSFHRSARAPPGAFRPAGHKTAVMTPQVTAHNFMLCRAPATECQSMEA